MTRWDFPCPCQTCHERRLAELAPRVWIVGPYRAPDSRLRIALEVVLAFLALAVAGAFFGAALGMLP